MVVDAIQIVILKIFNKKRFLFVLNVLHKVIMHFQIPALFVQSEQATWVLTNDNRSKSRNWDEWVLPLLRLSWGIYSRYRHVLSCSWLSRLSALTWIPSKAPRPNQTLLTIGQSRETGTSGSYPSCDYPEESIPGIDMYWVAADSRDFQLWPEYLPKHLDPTKHYLQ